MKKHTPGQRQKLAELADLLAEWLDPAEEPDAIDWLRAAAMAYEAGLDIPNAPRLNNTYSDLFFNSWCAVRFGMTNRLEYSLEFVAKGVAKGVLRPAVRRPVASIPQPTPRKDGDTGRIPWTGK